MNFFTYKDYIQCIHTINFHKYEKLQEESEEYILGIGKRDKNDKPDDKIIKNILENKVEFKNFLKQFLSFENYLLEEKIQKYTNRYINVKYKAKEADIVYKIKDEDIFFLIEHQSTIDYNMPYRILNYCVEIIQEWVKEKNKKKIEKYPVVVPIVIYTGKEKWKVPQNYKEQQVRITTYEKYRINLFYNIVDINRYNNEELLHHGTILSYAMIIEKSKNKEDLLKNIRVIIENEKDKIKLKSLENIILCLLEEILIYSEKDEIIEKIDQKVGESDMETLVARILDEEKKIRKGIEKRGEKKGEKNATKKLIINFSKKMLEIGQDEKIIKKVTGIKDEELEKIKRKVKW